MTQAGPGKTPGHNSATVEHAILYLDSCCDGATTTDGLGFSKYDVEPGKRLADKIKSSKKLNESEKRKAMHLVHKYRKQLANAGIDYEAAIIGAEKDTQSASTRLIEFVSSSNSELWHSPEQDGFITIDVNDHRENHSLKSKHIRQWLSKQFYEAEGKVPHNQALQDALSLLGGKANFDGPEYPVYIRVAGHEGNIYIDIGDESWEAIEITPNGWDIIPESPVKFLRPNSLLPLPRPVPGGFIGDLRKLLNAPTDDIWILSVAWLIHAFNPRGPYPILVINGEQGSAKSTFSRYLRSLIDPNSAPLRRPPRNEVDLMIAAKSGWAPCYDNLSGLSRDLSDGLCVLATGGGLGKRQLYTDDEEHIIYAQRPLILNGIDEVATRGDLMERSIIIHLPPIRDGKRRTEDEINAEFESIRSGLLGAILDAVATGLRRLPETRVNRSPRMADFARWVVACEPALPWEEGEFLEEYRAMLSNSKAAMVDNDFFATAVYNWATESLKPGEEHIDTASGLLNALEARSEIESGGRRPDGWPRTPRGLTDKLRRIAPVLRSVGADVQFLSRESNRRPIKISLIEGSRQTVLPNDDGIDDGGDDAIENSHKRNEPLDACCDGSDDSDGTDKRKSNKGKEREREETGDESGEENGGTGDETGNEDGTREETGDKTNDKTKEVDSAHEISWGNDHHNRHTVITPPQHCDFHCDGMKENSHPTVTPDTISSETEQQDDPSIKHGTDPKTDFNRSSASSSDKPSLSHAALKVMVNDDMDI